MYQEAIFNEYWQLDAKWGLGPENVISTVGGRDGLVKAYQAMMALGHQRQGDAILVSRVPWISYNWGPFGLGGNTLLAPGDPENGWAYTVDGLAASVAYARDSGREVAAVVITSPDNPTGRTMDPEQQATLARAALRAGAAYVLFDWIYHYVTDEDPMDLNSFLGLFDEADRKRLIFMDGLTKSLGASNIRNAHLIAPTEVVEFIVALASHGVIPPFHGQAVAMAAIEQGYRNACRPIVDPTNASRLVLKKFLDENNFTYILGKGYYAFLHLGEWMARKGWHDTEPFGAFLAEEHGLAVVPGVFFSSFGGEWVRFSYATPPETTLGALNRLKVALGSIT
jgi:aspartate aminotransferase